ncbi:MAG: hypothetical protein PHP42_08885, partial [Bacteroidota bacterium]|nr:hypothetical protein [Bacteroidota bacterium]
IIGLARYGVSIFNPYNHLFIFVMFALYFSMFFFIMRDMDLKSALYTLCILFILNEAFFRRNAIRENLLLEILSFWVYGIAVYLYFQYIYISKLKKYFLITGILGVLFFCAAVLFRIIYAATNEYSIENAAILLRISVPEFLLGFGIAIGVYVTDRADVKNFLRHAHFIE